MEGLNIRICLLGVLLLVTPPSRGSKVQDICYKWSLNGDGGFTVGDMHAKICYTDWNGEGNLIPDWATCAGYYHCPSQTAVGTWNHCPKNQHFNVVTRKCASPETYPCVYNRCQNVGSRNMAFVGTGCRSYVVCSTGVILQCPTNRPYFDEVTQTCELTKPAYNICTQDIGL